MSLNRRRARSWIDPSCVAVPIDGATFHFAREWWADRTGLQTAWEGSTP